jgi:hypothetical protein
MVTVLGTAIGLAVLLVLGFFAQGDLISNEPAKRAKGIGLLLFLNLIALSAILITLTVYGERLSGK